MINKIVYIDILQINCLQILFYIDVPVVSHSQKCLFQMMPNLTIDSKSDVKVQKTTIARTMDDAEESYKLIQLPKAESKMSLLGNLFLSEGMLNYQIYLIKAI